MSAERKPMLARRSPALEAVLGDDTPAPSPSPSASRGEAAVPPPPVRRRRTERLVPFATRIPMDLYDEVKAYCEADGILITDFTTDAMRFLLAYYRENEL